MSDPETIRVKTDFWKACLLIGEDEAAGIWAAADADQDEELEYRAPAALAKRDAVVEHAIRVIRNYLEPRSKVSAQDALADIAAMIEIRDLHYFANRDGMA